jgi:signal transduction histidine kinase
MRLSRSTVLILSTNPEFARELAAHWPSDPNPPEFTVLEQALFRDLAGGNYDLAIADGSSPGSRSKLKKVLAAAAKPAILIHSAKDSDHSAAVSREFRDADCHVIELSTQSINGAKPLWPVVAGFLGREILRRLQAEARARDAEAICVAAQADATLGRYIAEMRHNVNNALTSVLGNAELLTLEADLPVEVIAQAETILNMALRLHEVFQRFASLEKELSVGARRGDRRKETRAALSTTAGK